MHSVVLLSSLVHALLLLSFQSSLHHTVALAMAQAAVAVFAAAAAGARDPGEGCF